MVAMLLVIVLFIVVGLAIAIVSGIIALSPIWIILMALILLDVTVIKTIFRRKKKRMIDK